MTRPDPLGPSGSVNHPYPAAPVAVHRRPRCRRLRAIVVSGLVVAGTVAGAGGASRPAGASCAGPTIAVEPASVPAGGVLEVRGRAFGTDCNDTGGSGPPLGEPQAGISVRLAQTRPGGRTFPLALVDATEEYEFTVRVAVPPGVGPGPATVVVAGDHGTVRAEAIEVTAAAPAPVAATPATIVVGRPTGSDTASTPADDPGGVPGVAWLAVVAVLGGAGAWLLAVRARRRRV